MPLHFNGAVGSNTLLFNTSALANSLLLKRNPNPNFWVWISSGGMAVFHVKGWGPKSSVCPSKPGKPNFFAGYPRIFAGISRGCPKSLRKKVRVQFLAPKFSVIQDEFYMQRSSNTSFGRTLRSSNFLGGPLARTSFLLALLIECFRGRHTGGRNLRSCFCSPGPFVMQQNEPFSTG